MNTNFPSILIVFLLLLMLLVVVAVVTFWNACELFICPVFMEWQLRIDARWRINSLNDKKKLNKYTRELMSCRSTESEEDFMDFKEWKAKDRKMIKMCVWRTRKLVLKIEGFRCNFSLCHALMSKNVAAFCKQCKQIDRKKTRKRLGERVRAIEP